jgi:hypothetical protein
LSHAWCQCCLQDAEGVVVTHRQQLPQRLYRPVGLRQLCGQLQAGCVQGRLDALVSNASLAAGLLAAQGQQLQRVNLPTHQTTPDSECVG